MQAATTTSLLLPHLSGVDIVLGNNVFPCAHRFAACVEALAGKQVGFTGKLVNLVSVKNMEASQSVARPGWC